MVATCSNSNLFKSEAVRYSRYRIEIWNDRPTRFVFLTRFLTHHSALFWLSKKKRDDLRFNTTFQIYNINPNVVPHSIISSKLDYSSSISPLSGLLGRLSDVNFTLESHINPGSISRTAQNINFENRLWRSFQKFSKNQKFGLIFMVSVVNEISFVWYISCMTGTLGPG